MNFKKILKQAVDLHIHIGPEIIPRKFTLPQLLRYEKGKLKGVGIKNHFFPTVSMTKATNAKRAPFVINSVTLNNYIGGFNPDVIQASAELSKWPIIVWFPTLHASQFLKNEKLDIPKEWLDSKLKTKRSSTDKIKALKILDDNGKIKKEVKKVLNVIKKYGAILATGHISWKESRALVKYAAKIGIKKIIITHPIYQKINMPIKIQMELVKSGAIIESCYSMYSIDKIPIEKIAEQIKIIGAKNCILTSDVGQSFSQSPSEALNNFISLLKQNGITEKEIKIMLIANPSKLLCL